MASRHMMKAAKAARTLDQINEGYQDMRDGRNIRGVIRCQDGVGHDGR